MERFPIALLIVCFMSTVYSAYTNLRDVAIIPVINCVSNCIAQLYR